MIGEASMRGTPDYSDYTIALFEEKSGQVGPILSRDTGYNCCFHVLITNEKRRGTLKP